MKISNIKFINNYYHLFFVIILLYILTPFLILFYYNQPVNDDFYFAVEFRQFGFFNAISNYYFQFGGRVVALIHLSFVDFLISHIFWFRIIGVIFVLIHLYSVFYFLKTLFNKNELKLNFTFFVFFVIIELLFLPTPQQGFFWFTGMVAYILPFSYLLFTLSFYLKYNENRQKKYYFLTLLFLALASGSHELIAFILISILVLFKLVGFLQSNYNLKIYSFEIVIISILIPILLIVILAPGNSQRELGIVNNNSFLTSIIISLKTLFLLVIKWLQNGVIISISLLFISVISQKKYFFSNLKINNFILAVIGFIFILLFTILASLHFGGDLPYRVLNITFLLFIFFYFITIWLFISLLNNKFRITELNLIYKFLIMIFLIFQLKDGKIRIAYKDILSGDAKQFSKEWDIRNLNSKNNKGKELIVNRISVCPESICCDDLKEDSSNWRNRCYSGFYEIKNIKIDHN